MRLKSLATKFGCLTVVLCGIIFLLAGCTGQSNSNDSAGKQIATVQTGSIAVTVTGTGNLAP